MISPRRRRQYVFWVYFVTALVRFGVTCDTGLLDAAAVRETRTRKGGRSHSANTHDYPEAREIKFERAAGCVLYSAELSGRGRLEDGSCPFPRKLT